MGKKKGTASVDDLRRWLHWISLAKDKIAAAIEIAEKNSLDSLEEVPDTYELMTRAVRTGAVSILSAAEEASIPAAKKPTPEAKAGASVAKLIVKREKSPNSE